MMQIIRSRSVPAPDAMTDNYSITEDQLLVGSANGFLNNDSDPDGDPLSIILIDGLPFSFGTPITLASGANLTINADGSFQYDQNGSFTYLSAGQTVNDIFTYTISDGRFGFDTSAVCVTISGVTVDLRTDSTPTDTIPAPGGATTTVFEHGLPARGAEPAGSGEIADGNPTNNSDPSETVSGTIAFTSLDGVSVVSLGGHVLTGAPQTFADGTTGTLTASFTYNAATGAGVISYSYTLIDNTLVDPSSSSSFAVVVTDADGDSAPAGNLVISIIDDVPTAHADTDATAVGQFTAETGNVITAVGTTSPVSGVDVLGADGAVVSGVAAGTTNADLDNAATLNTPIQGAFGKLTLAADGSYSYTRDAGTAGGANDVFTYTIKDGDGDLSHTTLTISVGDSTPTDTIPAPGGATTTVFEHGLPARGSEPAGSGEIADGNPTNNSDPSETVSGTIAFTSLDGVSVVSLGGHVLTGAPQTFADGTTGTLTASFTYNAATGAGVISYSYTLIDNTLVDPSSSSSFAVVVTDADGDSAPAGNLVISIVDDVPTAHADTDATAVGQFTAETGNVITAVGTTSPVSGVDVLGADGAVVSGVAAGTTNADLDNAATLNTPIQGAFGKLTLAADGSYSYTRDAGTAGGANDVFTYTIKDGDGDLSHTTLTISVGDSTPTDTIPAPGGATTTVFEHGLPARGAEPAGSGEIADGNPTNNSDPSETVSGTIAFTSLDGVSVVSLGGHVLTGAPQTFADGTTGTLTASFTYNAATGAGVISYSYTLIDNTLVDPSSSSSFAVVVTDADGDSAPAGNLVISIIDDVPTAHADTDATAVGQFTAETGNVITAVGTTSPVSGVDVLGADGAVVSGVAAGTTNANLDNRGDAGLRRSRAPSAS